jgi:hypothetical protein
MLVFLTQRYAEFYAEVRRGFERNGWFCGGFCITSFPTNNFNSRFNNVGVFKAEVLLRFFERQLQNK